MGKLLQVLENWIGGGPGGEKRIVTFRWLMIIGLLGIMLMIINSFVAVDDLDPDAVQPAGNASPPSDETAFTNSINESSPFEEIERAYEDRMKQLLENIAGVNGVEVMVTIESTEEIVVYENDRQSQQTTEERDRNGANRHVTDHMREGELIFIQSKGNETPVVLKKLRPKISGVIVVAGGVEHATVYQLIIDAVQKGFGIPQHKIAVVPGKQRR